MFQPINSVKLSRNLKKPMRGKPPQRVFVTVPNQQQRSLQRHVADKSNIVSNLIINDLVKNLEEKKKQPLVEKPNKHDDDGNNNQKCVSLSKPRLPSLDALRFFLIAYIAVGHFINFATQDMFIIRLFAQVNVWVGAFFVLSGYVAGYTATELNKYAASPRIKPEFDYFLGRISGFYPLFAFVQVLFGAMFIIVDNFYNGPLVTLANGFLSSTLLQAWFPGHAEVWNAPTWFLSALAFAMFVLPYVLPVIAGMRKKQLRILLLVLTIVSLMSKIGYSYDLNTWFIFEGLSTPRTHPNMLLWNVIRFNPLYCLMEVLMGVVACRMVMTDAINNKNGEQKSVIKSALLPAMGLIAITVARAFGVLQLNDALTRGLLFIPLFIVLVMRLHRNTLAKNVYRFDMVEFLSHPWLTYLGLISFPIFILHGPLGQIFYKKIVATQLWGGVMPTSFFGVYLSIVLVCSALIQKYFVQSKSVNAKVTETSNDVKHFVHTTLNF